MSSDNHAAYVAVPMDIFSRPAAAPLTDSSRRRGIPFANRDLFLKIGAAVVVITLIVLVPLWIKEHRRDHKRYFMMTGGGGCRHWSDERQEWQLRVPNENKHDSQDVVKIELVDEPTLDEQMVVVVEEEEFYIDDEAIEQVWFGSEEEAEVSSNEEEEWQLGDIIYEYQEDGSAVDKPLQFFTTESSQDGEDGDDSVYDIVHGGN